MQDKCELIENGLVRFCFECERFPCIHLKRLDRRHRTKYHMSMIENLIYIKEYGIDKFLEEQDKKWNCPECNDVICCHNGLCLNCSIDILLLTKDIDGMNNNQL